jgi:hypothetical protein
VFLSGHRDVVLKRKRTDKAGAHGRIRPVDPRRATEKTRKLFAWIKVKSLLVPNLVRVLAHASAALEGFMNLSQALAGGSFDEKTREQIGLTVAKRASRTLISKESWFKRTGSSARAMINRHSREHRDYY